MKRLLILFLIPLSGFAQQDPQFTFNNDFNPYVNPSFMINEHTLNVTAWHRQQWVGFDGRPITTLANASYHIKKIKSAFGVSYLNDQLGAQRNQAALFNYAFDGQIRDHHIIPSIQVGVLHNSLDGNQLDPIQQNDPNIVSSRDQVYNFDLGLGLAYRWEGVTAAFSITHINNPTSTFETGLASSDITIARHYYGYLSYEAEIGKIWRLKPISFVKTDAASTQFDQFLWFGTRNLSQHFDGVSLGVGYRIDDAIPIGIEFKFPWFTAGYSYDITTSRLSNYSTGSHEWHLRVHLSPICQKKISEKDCPQEPEIEPGMSLPSAQ